jgi:hypothetical protein
MSRLRRTSIRDESGIALATVVLVGAVLTLLSVSLVGIVNDEGARSAQGVRRSASLHAAEAGLRDYMAKLTEDKRYYLNHIHPGESTRRSTGGVDRTAGQTWGLGAPWTYPAPKNAWRTLANGYEYNLQIAPPAAGSDVVQITATGRRTGSTTEWKAVEAVVRPTSLADFQMVSNSDIS